MSNTKFKVGDRVRVVDNTCSSRLTMGKLCTVSYVDDEYIGIDGSTEGQWQLYRFELEYSSKDSESDQLNKYRSGRRTFKLLKALPGVPKGTLFQEQCEDGTQPYSVLGDKYGEYTDLDVKLEYSNRSYVEDNPKWFTEVFKAKPEYMTADEIERWEAFNTLKTAFAKPARKSLTRAKTKHQGKSVYAAGTARVSSARMAEVVEAIKSTRTRKAAAKKLGVKPGTIATYYMMAKRNGLL